MNVQLAVYTFALFQFGIKKDKLHLDKMYIMVYICIYQSGGNVPAQKKDGYNMKKKNYKECYFFQRNVFISFGKDKRNNRNRKKSNR